MPQKKICALALAALVCAPVAQASGLSDKLSLRGFGTVGFTHSTEDQANFVDRMTQAEGAGYAHEWGFGVDSKFGAQVNARLSDQWSVVVQGIIQQQYDGEFRPNLEWANVRYAPTDDLSFRLGRIVAPTNMLSEIRNVGYAYTWARPPVDVYFGLPFTNIDGLDVIYRTSLLGFNSSFQLAAGTNESKFPATDGAATADFDAVAFNGSFQRGALTFRLGVSALDMEVDLLEQLASGVRGYAAASGNPAFTRIGNEYLSTETSIVYSAGATYDDGSWVLATELTYLDQDVYTFAPTTSAYASVGHRFGTFTPYVLAAVRKTDDIDQLDPALAGGDPTGEFLISQINAMAQYNGTSQHSLTAGTRWDFAPGKALKLQASHVRPDSGSYGTLSQHQPGYVPGQSYNVYTANLDFVF